MTNKNYNNGRAKEYRIKKKLEAEGWFVIRSAGSHSIVDLIALKNRVYADVPAGMEKLFSRTTVRLIQCKPKGGYLTPKEWEKKEALEKKLGLDIEVL